MSLADPTTHTSAVVARLQLAGIVTGDAAPPPVRYGWQGTPGRSRFIPYAVVYQLDQTFDGSLGAPDADSDLSWQVTCTADTRAACDTLRRAVNEALIGQSLTVAGRHVPRIRADGGAGTRREDQTTPTGAQVVLFVSQPRFAALSH